MNSGMDERMTILKMIESDKITVEQGAQLLGALGKAAQQADPAVTAAPAAVQEPSAPSHKETTNVHGRRFRVQITDTVTGKTKVSVNLPLSLVRWGMRTGKKFSSEMDDIDLDELADMLESGENGQFIEVIDEEDGEHVRVFIE